MHIIDVRHHVRYNQLDDETFPLSSSILLSSKLRIGGKFMAEITTPTNARANLFKLIQSTNRNATPIIIAGSDDSKSAVLMSKRDYDAQQETMALLLNGQIQDALNREGEKAVDLDEMIKELDNE
jgi:prevent-host-death family protein